MKSLHRIRATDFAKLLKTQGKHNDGGSLYLVVRGGSARFEYQYREGGKCKSQWLGSAVGYAPISLAQAREARVKAWLDRRGNGQQQPRQARSVASGKRFPEALDAWLAANPNRWTVKGVKERRGLAKLSLASLDIAKISQADVLVALENETPRMHANKRGWLADLFSFAKVQGWRTGDNPARFDKDMLRGFAKVERGEGHAAIAWQDFPAVFAALPDTEIGRAVRFTALTAARAGEVEGATWKEIVGENGNCAWVIPAERMKAGKAHRVPLTPQALALLGERGPDDAPLLVPSRSW